MPTTKVIAICNQKGGVGKTTTTVNLGIGLAMKGKRVLLVDADLQGSLTTSLGWYDHDALPQTIADVMLNIIHKKDFDPHAAILRHDEGVDLLPSSLAFAGMEQQLFQAYRREEVLHKYFDLLDIKQHYDYVLIDCPPTLGLVTINALAAADSVIIPVQAQYLPAVGMVQLLETIKTVRQDINPHLKTDGVLLTFSNRTVLARQTAETIRKKYGRHIKIYKTQIPTAVKAAESSAAGKSVYAYDKGGSVAVAYGELTKEVVVGGKKARFEPTSSR